MEHPAPKQETREILKDENATIKIGDIRAKRAQLEAKLEVYRQRLEASGDIYRHPDYITFLHSETTLLKPVILELLLGLASDADKPDDGKIYLSDVAGIVQDQTGLSVAEAATVPFVYNNQGGVYEFDIDRVKEVAGYTGLALVDVWQIMMGYTSGNMWGIYNSTGLPSVEADT